MQGHVVDVFEYEKGIRPDEPQAYDPPLDPKWNTR